MTRRVFLLLGLAILGVVLNHAGGWGQIAMFLWTDRYMPVSVPYWDQLGTSSHYVLLVIRQFGFFSVPAFLFVSGFFVAYATRGSVPVSVWKVVTVRIRNLLAPYLIWSGVIVLSDMLQGRIYKPIEYLQQLVTMGVNGGYFYIPLLCYLYLLSPLMIPVAKTRWRLLLSATALIQASGIIMHYLGPFWIDKIHQGLAVCTVPAWLPTNWVFFFALGMVTSLRIKQSKRWLVPRRWSLLAAVVSLFLLSALESDALLRATKSNWFAGYETLSYNLLAVACILCFLAFDNVSIPLSGAVHEMGKKSYAIYLLHSKVMEFVARVIRQLAPWMLEYQVLLFVPLMFVVGLGIPLLLTALVAMSPAKRAYRYLFG